MSDKKYMFYDGCTLEVELNTVNGRSVLTDEGFLNLYKTMSIILMGKARKATETAGLVAAHTYSPNADTGVVTTTKIIDETTTEQRIPSAVSIPVVTPQPKPTGDTYSPEQITRIKAIKKRMGIFDNKGLNGWLERWSQGHITSVDKLHPSTINDFMDYLDKQA